MVSSVAIFTTVLFSSLFIHTLNMKLATKTTRRMTDRAKAEYHRHACGRAIAAIHNFNVIANGLQKLPGSHVEAISDTFLRIEAALTRNYGEFYVIKGRLCIDRGHLKPVVTVYRRGPDRHVDEPNFSYRFL